MITSSLLEAYLACPTKFYLRSIGEVGTGNAFASWSRARSDRYRIDKTRRLSANVLPELVSGQARPGHLIRAQTQPIYDFVLSPVDVEQHIHAVQRTPLGGLVPIRFVHANKLSSAEKMLVTFDALVLSNFLRQRIDIAKIVYGDNNAETNVTVESYLRDLTRLIKEITILLSTGAPPALILNRHCPECEFRDSCRKKAIENDDLSLLAGITEKERARLNSRGIFTVNQLSYTFRPRRRSKRLAAKSEKYHHPLKALALREQKIHMVGTPMIKIAGTPVYFDVEAIPDQDFYYLIGVQLEGGDGGPKIHSLWADTESDERLIWGTFLEIMSKLDKPCLVHYGSFEAKFLKKMCDRYGGPPQDSTAAIAIASPLNLVSVIFSQIYFPSYSNGLKEIARYLGFQWTDPTASGLQSIVWRHLWEESRDPTLRSRLITYNADDCAALSLVARAVSRLTAAGLVEFPEPRIDIVQADSIGGAATGKWTPFKSPIADLEMINLAARWNYQRDRVFVRSGVQRRKRRHESKTPKGVNVAEKVVLLQTPRGCPKCGKKAVKKERLSSRTVQDLIFGRDSLKRRVVQYVGQINRCRSCGNTYGPNELRLHGQRWGWNMNAFFIYHAVGLCIPQLTVQHSMNRIFGTKLVRSTLNQLKAKTSEYYQDAKRKILERIVSGDVIQADETSANVRGCLAYVWVLTNLKEVVFILAESREGDVIWGLLKDFKGVLVSDFYSAYDAIKCPQQKCLIHLMRDLNDEMLNNPFDEEAKSIVLGFAALLKPIVETIDRHGLKRYFLRRHLVKVDEFYSVLDGGHFKSDVALKLKQRFSKNREKLFTFLGFDGVPWNNNNAEHAIKAFAKLRDVISGLSTKKGIDEYLTLLSVSETCNYRGVDFLDFIRSGEKDVETFASNHGRFKRR